MTTNQARRRSSPQSRNPCLSPSRIDLSCTPLVFSFPVPSMSVVNFIGDVDGVDPECSHPHNVNVCPETADTSYPFSGHGSGGPTADMLYYFSTCRLPSRVITRRQLSSPEWVEIGTEWRHTPCPLHIRVGGPTPFFLKTPFVIARPFSFFLLRTGGVGWPGLWVRRSPFPLSVLFR